jgi:hypothetical protein
MLVVDAPPIAHDDHTVRTKSGRIVGERPLLFIR